MKIKTSFASYGSLYEAIYSARHFPKRGELIYIENYNDIILVLEDVEKYFEGFLFYYVKTSLLGYSGTIQKFSIKD